MQINGLSLSMLKLVAGVDEVGRGPLAGDVVAAAVILPENYALAGLTDSKKLSEKKRLSLFTEIKSVAISWALGRASVGEIDQLNILHASLLAMRRAVDALDPSPQFVQVDGNRLPSWNYPSEAIVQGDVNVAAISAASIIAKVTRDAEMLELDALYPAYGFAAHKGYPTKAHLLAIEQNGICPAHRKSFGPVKKKLERLSL